MPNIRFTLWIVLGAVLYYNYLAWQQDYRPLPQLTSTTAGGAGTRGSLGNSVPTPEGAAASAVPAQSGAATPAAAPVAPSDALGTAPESSAAKVHVVTDVLDLDISLHG